MSKRRVVVTGLGVVSPVGNGITEAWGNLLKGASGVGPITHFDASVLPTRIAAEVKGFKARDWMPLKETRRSDTFIHYGIAATKMALDDAGFTIDDANAERVGVNVGSGIGGLPMIEDNIREMIAKGPAAPVAVLRARHDHQHGGGPDLDPVQGPRARTSRWSRPAPPARIAWATPAASSSTATPT
jgi:3-oxoacyl-(acyl-carrier-protein) synthase